MKLNKLEKKVVKRLKGLKTRFCKLKHITIIYSKNFLIYIVCILQSLAS